MTDHDSQSYAAQRQAARAARAAAARTRVARSVDADRWPDPLRRPETPVWRWAAWVLAAVGLHVATAGVFAAANAAMFRPPPPSHNDGRVELEIRRPPPEPQPEPAPELPPEPEPPAPAVEQPVAPQPKPRPKPERREPTPSADPIDTPNDEPEPTKPPPRRIVGLSMESTVEGSQGPAFAIGNTRMGTTDRIAEDPTPGSLSNDESPQRGQNQAATRIPAAAAGGKGLVRPKVLDRVEPEYPQLYRAQNLEADVVVKVRIDETGEVIEARLVVPSKYEAFNAPALAAAKKTRFSPCLKDGQPIPWTVTYTVRYRIRE